MTPNFEDAHTIQLGGGGGALSGRVLRPGLIVGGTYKLKSLLGHGGMGYVFCAEHTIIGRDYALKVLSPDMLNEDSRRRFEAEGRAIANLDHVNIVKVYNMGIYDGDCPFYVMDLLDGMSLSDCIQGRGGIDLVECLDIFSQIAAGLGYAHSRGIIHRDVKPSNIILLAQNDSRLLVKIVDFGIAKLLTSAGHAGQSQTATGEVFGTPFYMSPEQCMGGVVDARSDVYSLGCALFETISGRPPYCGQNALATVMMHQAEAIPSVLTACPDKNLPPQIDVLLGKMLAKRPEERYQSMEQVLHDLDRLKDGRPIGRAAVGTASLADLPASEAQKESAFDDHLRSDPPGHKIRQKSLLLAAALCLPVIAALVLWPYGSTQSKSKPLVPVVVIHLSTQVSIDAARRPLLNALAIDAGLSPYLPANGSDELPDLAQARSVFRRCPLIVSKPEKHNGKIQRRFDFPACTIGTIDIDSGHPSPAKGTVYVPRKERLTLSTSVTGSAAICLPEIFEKIGSGEFETLSLMGGGNDGSQSSLPGYQPGSEKLASILKTASHWSRLTNLSLNSFTIGPGALSALDQMQTLDHLEIHSCQWRQELIRPRPFFLRLRELQVSRTNWPDEIVACVAGAPNLARVRLDNVMIKPNTLLSLGGCPRFAKLEFSSMDVNDDIIKAVILLQTIREVRFSATAVTRGQLKELNNCPHIVTIKIVDRGSSAKDEEECRRLFDKVKIVSDLKGQEHCARLL